MFIIQQKQLIALSTLKKKRTEGRLSNLLSRIRSKNSDDSLKRKIKKLHAKYQRYNPHLKEFKLVKPNNRGGVRFIDIECNVVTTYGSIKDKLQSIYFDLDGCNNFLEDQFECMITICDSSGLPLDESENIWDYLERKGEVISKTNVVLRSQSCDFESEMDDETLEEILQQPAISTKRKICQTCNCSYEGTDCLICIKNSEYAAGLENDMKLQSGFDTIPFPELVGLESVESEEEEQYVHDVAETRSLRINHFSSILSDNKTIKIHRMKLREDLLSEIEKVGTVSCGRYYYCYCVPVVVCYISVLYVNNFLL